jgi:hypothetical protein
VNHHHDTSTRPWQSRHSNRTRSKIATGTPSSHHIGTVGSALLQLYRALQSADTLEFEFEEDSNTWKCFPTIHKALVEVHLVNLNTRPSLTKEAAANHVVETVEGNWNEIRSCMAASLLGRCSSDWAAPEDGSPTLSEEEFLNKLNLEAINYDVECGRLDSLCLYFSESGIFGGHGIEVFWQKGANIQWKFVDWEAAGK